MNVGVAGAAEHVVHAQSNVTVEASARTGSGGGEWVLESTAVLRLLATTKRRVIDTQIVKIIAILEMGDRHGQGG